MLIIKKKELSPLYLLIFGLLFACTRTSQLSELSETRNSDLKQNKSFTSHPKKQFRDQVQGQSQTNFRQWHSAPTRSLITSQDDRSTTHLKLQYGQNKKSTKLHIGVLLPLSGPYQTWGNLIKESLLHIENLYSPFVFRFTDTHSDSIYAQTALDLMLNQSPTIDLLIGPLSPQAILHLSQRIQWYELPWFPLGSIPTLSSNHFNFSWRLEAQDEAQTLAQALCKSQSKTAAILLVDQPKNRLLAKRLQRLIKSCAMSITRTVIMTTDEIQQNVKSYRQQKIVNALIKLSGRSLNGKSHPWWSEIHKKHTDLQSKQKPNINYEALVILAQGQQLRSLLQSLSKWDLEVKAHSEAKQKVVYKKYPRQEPPWLKIYTGLGSGPIVNTLMKTDTLEGLVCIARSKLSVAGQTYLKRRPQANSLELELADLMIWLDKARVLSYQNHIPIIKALRAVSEINGQWGVRRNESSKLIPAELKYFQVQNRKLRAIY